MEKKNGSLSSSFSSPSGSKTRGKFRPTTRSNPCQICQRFGDCSISADGEVACCRKIEEGSFKMKEDRNGRACYFHRLTGDRPSTPLVVAAASTDEIERADDQIL